MLVKVQMVVNYHEIVFEGFTLPTKSSARPGTLVMSL